MYVATTGRHPFVTEAVKHGYLIGNREDSNYQLSEEYSNVGLFNGFMDNDYENPDLDRFLEEYEKRQPSVAVIGDAYNKEQAEKYQFVIDELKQEYPHRRFIVAPKSEEVFEYLDPENTTLGYANGNSPVQGQDLGPARFREWDVHILGGNPIKAYTAIEKLTQPTIDGRPPANIVGYDWNGPLRMAYWEFWTPEGWEDNGSMTPRETARRSYEEIKQYLSEKGIWPDTEPIQLYGEPTQEPDELLWMDDGGDPISSIEDLEKAHIGEYEQRGTLAFKNQSHKQFIEYREDINKA